MAQDSISLQEAIATLSTSNLRQRRDRGTFSTGRTEPARMSSLAHRALMDIPLQECSDPSIPEGFAHEEQYHRGMAVKELNKELADPQQRLSDSVLATLLILCLFHVCDTGVGQFKTQFAGVTKLLSIRLRASPYLSEELKWFIRMFTWYDTMTSTTNDRELQLHSRYVDLTAASDGEWGLENLAGCDAGLFKIISHLGRLNLLSQSQEHTPSPPHIFVPTSVPPPSMTYHNPEMLLSGLPTQIDPYLFPLPTPPRPGDQTKQPSSSSFWAEWYSIKQQLEAWRFPQERPNPGHIDSASSMYAYMSPPSSPLYQSGVAPQNVEDVFHISESFRHSALLYSERLAYPDLPSSHPRIQQIVQRSMAHILAVKSDVYLLWPLFITGSECVYEEHRIIIQERCKDISKDSGFCNNLSCLELLQRIWAENPPAGAYENGYGGLPVYQFDWPALDGGMSLSSLCKGQGFRWQHVMQAKRAEGEYMVV
ncbi:fungal-specific transcription factor domain-containing protein [Aspergillus multicolor]|uniref:fungal specific transcription factor domain-containing protein n=1 Tax=Aspergillus multicolor TaxID=41759 RepID=UPI003CCCC330